MSQSVGSTIWTGDPSQKYFTVLMKIYKKIEIHDLSAFEEDNSGRNAHSVPPSAEPKAD
jgi:hypothetical protein